MVSGCLAPFLRKENPIAIKDGWITWIAMKKFFRLFLLSLLCLISIEKSDVLAQENSNYQYEENGDGITITGYSGIDTVLSIPEEINGKKVTIIGEYAFSGKHLLEKVTLPSTIKKIEKGAFFKDESLSSVKIEKSDDGHEIRIETLAMADCPVLSSLALPNNVTYIAEDFVMRSAETVLGSQSWSEEKLYLYVETESDAKYVLDRLRSGEISTSGVIRIITEGLDEPQNVSCHSYGNNKITAEWNYVAGASAYQVYRKIDGNYELIATVEENSFTEDYVVNNYLYLYKIKAVGSVYGKTEVVSATMGWDAIGSRISDVRNIHAVPLRRNAVTLSWNSKDSYVDGYIIYQKSGNSWKKIKQVSADRSNTAAKKSTTITGLTCGKNYTFAVQAYHADAQESNLYACSQYTTYTTTVLVRPAATSIQKITKYQGVSNKVQWNASKDASGYVVYRSTSKNGTYQRVAVIKSGAKLYYIDKNVKSGKKYYYKVAVYRNVNGKNVKSKVSTAVAK